MKLSAHHAAHGLEGSVRLLETGETFHIRFPKGKFKAQAQVNIGGHRFETAFVLEAIEAAPQTEVDMRIRLEAPVGGKVSYRELPAPSKDAVSENASDGSPMSMGGLPIGAPRVPRHYVANGLPPGTSPEPAPREMTSREVRNESKMMKLEAEMAGEGEVKAAPKKKAGAARKPLVTP